MKRHSRIFLLIPLALGAFASACSNYSGTLQGNSGGVITFLSPADIRAGNGDFILTVNGAGFDKTTVVRWNGQNRTTTLINSSQVTAVITAADVAQPGTATIDTYTKTLATGTGYNGLSNTIAFTISPAGNPSPTITKVDPNSAPAKSPDLTLTVTGTNFLQGSVINWNVAALATKFVSATQLTATVPASLLLVPGTATVTVFNPAPGGGTSPGGLTFTITPATAAVPSSRAATSASLGAPAISGNGRFVAFTAASADRQDVFVQDTCAGVTEPCSVTTTRVSVAADGSDANGASHSPSISADGRYIAFESAATNLVASETSGTQIFLRDTCLGVADCTPSTVLISVDSEGLLGGNDNVNPSISASGRFVAFVSVTADPSNPGAKAGAAPVAADASFAQVFVRDTCIGAAQCTPRTVRISLHNIERPASELGDANNSAAFMAHPALASDGSRVAIAQPAANIFTPSTRISDDVFLALTNPNR